MGNCCLCQDANDNAKFNNDNFVRPVSSLPKQNPYEIMKRKRKQEKIHEILTTPRNTG